jgi:hypothetical protein
MPSDEYQLLKLILDLILIKNLLFITISLMSKDHNAQDQEN